MPRVIDTVHGVQMISLSEIRHDQNVREQLRADEVDALAASIALLGQLTPVSVRPDTETDGFVLIAGHKRYAALEQLGYTEIRAEVRADAAGEASERAAENIVRSQLNPSEEASAVKAMLDRGLTEDGAAQALGWPKARVTARVKLLELPEKARQLVGAGTIALSAVDQLRAIGGVSRELLEILVDHVADDPNGWIARDLPHDPGRALGAALRESDSKVFVAYLHQLPHGAVQELRLGKKTQELMVEAEKLHRKNNKYAYGPPTVRFNEADVDQARAAGVLIEFEHSQPIVVDRSVYHELAKQAVRRTVEQLRVDAERIKIERKELAHGRRTASADPVDDARREHGQRMRELAEQAHGANTDLGWALRNSLATVDSSDITVARFFVFALLGSDYDGSPYTQSGDLVAELAMRGIRLVIDEFRTYVTKTLKSGERGKLRIDYGDAHKPEAAIAWLWKFVDGAKTAGELYGRALVVIAAEQYASRLVLPSSQQFHVKRWPSHKDHAAKALAKLAGPHIPASLKQLEKAVAKAKAGFDEAQRMANTANRQAAIAARRTGIAAKPDVEAEASIGYDIGDEQFEAQGFDDFAEAEPNADELEDIACVVGPDGNVYSDTDPGL
jgi:ParB/RepB/Spo0J family partition protein